MTDLGTLNYFLGISAIRHSTWLFLSQKQYAIELLARAHMTNCNPSRTPVDTDSKLGPEGVPVQDPTLYRSLAGAYNMLHLRNSGFWISLLLFYYHLSCWVHRCGLGRLPLNKAVYFSYCVFLGDNLLSWSSKCQKTISRSSAEAEYRGVANVVAETAWLRSLLRELHSPLFAVTLVYCDNVSATYLSANPVELQQTKHIEIDIYFVRDLVTAGQV
nr:ribonuclease H-like domain-containing protein [Tanacetum cinerariifolium]